MSRNDEVAKVLFEIAEILEFQGVDFKPRAYQRAAQNVEAHGEDVAALVKEDRLDEVPGVGASIAKKVKEYLETGRLQYLDKLRSEVPSGLLAIMRVPGVGPKRAKALHDALNVESVEQLQEAASAGKIRQVEGFGEKSEKEILKAIARREQSSERFPYGKGLEAAETMIDLLGSIGKAERVVYAGSLRRGRDTLGDVDLLASAPAKHAEALMEAFVQAPDVEDVLAHGKTKSSVRIRGGLQVDLRVVEPKHFGAAYLYFTGSKDHNVALRTRAQKKGWTLNEYTLARKKDEKTVAAETEERIYDELGLAWVPPEMRENRGEIELAEKGTLPDLIELGDVRADLHTHTQESDGHASAREMLSEAKRIGRKVYGISDHSAGLGVARGLDGKRLAKQRKQIDKMRQDFSGMEILQGCELEIKKSGQLDLTAKDRAALDYTIGSVHSNQGLDPDEQTARILKAIEQGIDILGHPMGRRLGQRPPMRFDHDKVFAACADKRVLVEIDSQPERLDLWGDLVRTAKEAGCRFVIDSDAHTVETLHLQRFGVVQARRGWLEAKHVVSTYTPNDLMKHLGHAKKG